MGYLVSKTPLVSVGAAAESDAPTIFTTSTNLDLTGESGNLKVFADSSGGVLSVTLPAGTAGQVVEVIDAGESAGANVITIVGTIDGATNATIEADGATREFTYSGSAWESSGGFERFFTREAATGRISAREPDTVQVTQINGGDSGSSYSGGTGDFTDAEANVDQNAAGWRNDITYGSDVTAPATTITAPSGTLNGAVTQLIDNNNGTFMSFTSTSGTVRIDFGQNRQIQAINWNPYVGFLTDYTVWVSSSAASGYTQVATIDVSGDTTGSFNLHEFTNANNVRYMELRFSGARLIANEAEFFEGSVATTTNTFTHRVHTSGGSLTFTPSSLVLRDSGVVQLVNGEVLVEYSTDNGSTWPGGQRSLTDFTALGNISGTSFWLRYEMVGAKNMASSSIQTASSYASMANDGMNVTVAGSVVATFGSAGADINTAMNLKNGGSTFSSIGVNGMLLPSFTTTARDAISTPATGLTIYNTTTNKLNFYNGSSWEAVTSA